MSSFLAIVLIGVRHEMYVCISLGRYDKFEKQPVPELTLKAFT